MNFKTKVYNNILKQDITSFSEKEILKRLKIFSDFEREQYINAIEALAFEGLLNYDKKSKKYSVLNGQPDEKDYFEYNGGRKSGKARNGKSKNTYETKAKTKGASNKPLNVAGAIKGRISGNSKGFAFVICEDKTLPDIFIAPRNLHGAMHNDTVLVKLIPKFTGTSDEGEVISILQRGAEIIVGTFISSDNYGFVEPDDKRYYADIFVTGKNTLEAKTGQKVVVKITEFPGNRKNPEGVITEILGDSGDSGIDVLSIIRSFNLYEEFDEETLAAAKKAPASVSKETIQKREDLTGYQIVTIDGEDAKDLDDAISISKNEDGTYRLGVHIADVAHYVKENSPLDKEAFKRGTSVYFPDRVLPMLPRELSNGICSLNPGALRLTLTVFMDVDGKGNVINSRISETVIKSGARMTYTSVTKILEGDAEETEKYKDFKDMFCLMEELARILTEKRVKRGSIDFDMPEAKITVDEKGEVSEIIPYPRKISNKIIEEFMILANETVAETYFNAETPFVYRIHETPSQEKLLNFREFLKGFGYEIGTQKDINPLEFSMLLSKIEGQPEFSIINKVMLRTMMKAKYSPQNTGHFALASKYYCHFTSPIRRYPDLMIHRIIKMAVKGKLEGKKLDSMYDITAAASIQSSERERVADDAEREVDDYFKAKYMEKHIGEEFDGVISGVTESGIFAELYNTVEGMVRIEDLPGQYEYIKNDYVLKGQDMSFRLGGKLRIKVLSVNLSARKVDFALAEDTPVNKPKKSRKKSIS